MRCLVTGGAGFIGSHVVDALIEAGHEVTVVDDLSTGRRENLNPRARFVESSIRSAELASVFGHARPEVVFHLAAQINVTASVNNPEFDAETNVLGTIQLLEQCVRVGVKRFIFTSTGGAIYGSPKALPVSEEAPVAPLSPYAASKLCGEEYVKLYQRMYGLTYVILRYTNVFGPRQVPHGECGVCAVLTELMLQGRQPTLFGFGEPVRDYVYVGDVAKANVLALNKGDGACLNICSGKPTTVNEIFEALKVAIGYALDPMRKPLRPGEVEKIYCTNDLARRVLGWTPSISLEEGLKETIAFMRA
jgi:UDP-glucose 4-epimerase